MKEVKTVLKPASIVTLTKYNLFGKSYISKHTTTEPLKH